MKKILFDADVLIHFSKAEALDVLLELYPGRISVLEQVRQELWETSAARIWLETQFVEGTVEHIVLPSVGEVIQEYAQLISRMGKGESACLVLARYNDRYLASSNIRDIQKYCNKNKIGFVTTMDVICMLEDAEIWDRAACDNFIKTVKARGSRLPVKTLAEYRKRFKVRAI